MLPVKLVPKIAKPLTFTAFQYKQPFSLIMSRSIPNSSFQ